MDTTILEGLYRSLDVTKNTEMLLSTWGTESRFHFTPQMCVLIKGAFKPDTLWWSDMNQLDQTPKEESDTLFRNVYVCDAPNTCWCDIKHALIWKAITHSLRETDTSNNQRRDSTMLMFQSLTHKQETRQMCLYTSTSTISVTKMG